MDVRDISNVFVLKNCARTSGSDTIDGASVTTTVQAHVALADAGTAANSYYGPGELLITDSSGLNLTNLTALKAIPQINIKQRSYDGNHHYAYPALKGSTLKSYEFTAYAAKSEQTTVLHTIDATLNDHSYMIKIRKLGTDTNRLKVPTTKTAYFKSAVAGSTAAQIATGLVAYINTNFNTDPVMPLSAVVGGASNDAVIITALPLEWELGKYKYDRLSFDVVLANFTGTLVNNMYADLTYNLVTYAHATLGAGNYQQVVEMENFSKLYTGANKDLMSGAYRRTIVPMDAQQYEDDGTTANRYDTVVINWENIQGDFSANVRQEGSVILFFPMDDNATNQQAAVIGALNTYVAGATGWGVGSAITLST